MKAEMSALVGNSCIGRMFGMKKVGAGPKEVPNDVMVETIS